MKRHTLLPILPLAALAALNSHAAPTALPAATTAVVRAAQAAPILLRLSVQARVVTADAQGREQVFWQPLGHGGVRPGDVLRYTLAGENHGPLPVSGLILTQPIPVEATFLPHSITGSDDARVTYSVDRGRTFDAAPTVRIAGPGGIIQTLPAPPTAYTHVRWTLLGPVAPGASVRVACEVKVD